MRLHLFQLWSKQFGLANVLGTEIPPARTRLAAGASSPRTCGREMQRAG